MNVLHQILIRLCCSTQVNYLSLAIIGCVFKLTFYIFVSTACTLRLPKRARKIAKLTLLRMRLVIAFMLRCLLAFHTDLSRIFQPCISCAAVSSPAFLPPAIFFVPNFYVVHFQSPRHWLPTLCSTIL